MIAISTAPTTETTITAYSRPTTIENLPLLPKDSSYLNLANMEIFPDNYHEDYLVGPVNSIHDLNEAIEILKWLDARNKKETLLESIKNILTYYPENEIRQSEFLKKEFKLSIAGEGEATLKINRWSYRCRYLKSQDKSSLEKKFMERIMCKSIVSKIALRNGNISIVDKIFRHVLERANSFLKFTARDRNAHYRVNCYLWSFIQCVKPEYQNNIILRYQSYLAKNLDIAEAVSLTLIGNKDSKAAVKFLEKALDNLEGQPNKLDLGCCLFNMGVALARQRKFQESLSYHLLAYEMLPPDATVLKELMAIADLNGRPDIAREALLKFPNPQLKILLGATSNVWGIDRSTISIIKEMKGSDIPKEFHFVLDAMKFVIDERIWLKGGEVDEPRFTEGIKILQAKKCNKILVLSICIIFDQINIAHNLINDIDEEIIIAEPMLQKFNAFLHDHKSRSLVDKIESYDISEQEKAQLHFDAASACIAKEELEQAGQHLATAIALEPSNQTYIQADLLRTALSNDIMKLEDYSSKMDEKEREEIFAEFSSNIEIFDKSQTKEPTADELFSGLDPKKIHDYFQNIKAQKLAILSQSHFAIQPRIWNIGARSITSDQVVSLGERRGLQYYGYIDPKLLASLREHSDSLFNALNKGFVRRLQAQNGVKFIQGKAIELKTNLDLSLFTSTIYVNKNKEFLIIFDRDGNHNEVKKFAASSSIFYVEQQP